MRRMRLGTCQLHRASGRRDIGGRTVDHLMANRAVSLWNEHAHVSNFAQLWLGLISTLLLPALIPPKRYNRDFGQQQGESNESHRAALSSLRSRGLEQDGKGLRQSRQLSSTTIQSGRKHSPECGALHYPAV